MLTSVALDQFELAREKLAANESAYQLTCLPLYIPF